MTTLNIATYFYNLPTIIQISWVLSSVFVFFICLITFYLKHLRNNLRVKGRIEQTYQKKYESDLINYLYSINEGDNTSNIQENITKYLRKSSKNSVRRKVIISTLLKLRNEISGEMADSIQILYCQTGLIDYASAKLKSKKWNIIASGIRELTQFQIKESHDEIIEHVNHPKREVRKEMQLYFVTIFNFEGLKFLDIITNQLSDWDQIQLLEILQRFENQRIPDINPWLTSSNDSVVSFAIKLAKIYNQFESKDTLLKLLFHPNKTIRIDTIDVLNHLYVVETIPILKKEFPNLSIEEKIAFFILLENLFDNDDVLFIFENKNSTIFEIKVSANKILKEVNYDSINTSKKEIIEAGISESTNLTKAS